MAILDGSFNSRKRWVSSCLQLAIFVVLGHESVAQTCQTQIHTRTDSQTVPCSLSFSVRRRICLNGDTVQTVRNLNAPAGAWVCAPQSSLGSCTGSCNSTSVTVRILCVFGVSRINCPFTYTIKNCDNLFWDSWTTQSSCAANNYTFEGQERRTCYNCDDTTVDSRYCPGNSTRQVPCTASWTNYTISRNCSYASPSCSATIELTRQCLYQDGNASSDTSLCSSDSAVKVETCSLPYDCPASWTNWTTTRNCSYVSPSCSATISYSRQCLYHNGTQVSNTSLCSNESAYRVESCSLPYACPANWTEWSIVQSCSYIGPSCTATERYYRTCEYLNGTSAIICSGDEEKIENCTLPTPCPANWTEWSIVQNCSYVSPSCTATERYYRTCEYLNGTSATLCSGDGEKIENCTLPTPCPANWTEWETTRNCSYVYPSCTPSLDRERQCLYLNGTQADSNACSSEPATSTDNCGLPYVCCGCDRSSGCPNCPADYTVSTTVDTTTIGDLPMPMQTRLAGNSTLENTTTLSYTFTVTATDTLTATSPLTAIAAVTGISTVTGTSTIIGPSIVTEASTVTGMITVKAKTAATPTVLSSSQSTSTKAKLQTTSVSSEQTSLDMDTTSDYTPSKKSDRSTVTTAQFLNHSSALGLAGAVAEAQVGGGNTANNRRYHFTVAIIIAIIFLAAGCVFVVAVGIKLKSLQLLPEELSFYPLRPKPVFGIS